MKSEFPIWYKSCEHSTFALKPLVENYSRTVNFSYFKLSGGDKWSLVKISKIGKHKWKQLALAQWQSHGKLL